MGTAGGGTIFLFSRVASEDATIISIDLPGEWFGGGYHKWRKFLYKSFALPGQRIHLLRTDSHKVETLEEVKRILNGRKVDFLFIDGDHTYEGVKKDFEMYSKLVERESNSPARHSLSSVCSGLSGGQILEGDKAKAQGKRDNFVGEPNMGWDWSSFHLKSMGIIAFPDIVPGPSECVGGVPEFWQEIKSNYEFMEIVEDWNQGGFGIGIIKWL